MAGATDLCVSYQRRKNVIVEPASELQDVTFGVNDAYWLETSVYQTRPDGARLKIDSELAGDNPFVQAAVDAALPSGEQRRAWHTTRLVLEVLRKARANP
jgi:hypothetical protein